MLALVTHFAAFPYIAPLVDGQWSVGVPEVGVLLLVFGVAGAVGLAAVVVWGLLMGCSRWLPRWRRCPRSGWPPRAAGRLANR